MSSKAVEKRGSSKQGAEAESPPAKRGAKVEFDDEFIPKEDYCRTLILSENNHMA